MTVFSAGQDKIFPLHFLEAVTKFSYFSFIMMSKRCGDRWYASDYTAISYETVDRKKEQK